MEKQEKYKNKNVCWTKVFSYYHSGSLMLCYLTFRGFLTAVPQQEKE